MTNAVVSQSEVEAQFESTDNAGWAVGIGLSRAFETANPSNNIFYASTVASNNIELPNHERLNPQPQQTQPETKVSTKTIALATTVAVGHWQINQRRREDGKQWLIGSHIKTAG